MATILKLLIMGLPSSGKTTFVKHIFEEKEFEEVEDYRPTFGVGISLYEFKGSKGVMVSTFDCGGQTSFIDTYMTDQWVPTLFGKVSAFFFLVDSSTKANLDDAAKLFRKYYENLRRNSENAKAYVLASKWDKHVVRLDELRPFFKDMDIYSVSVLDGSARKVFEELMANLVEERRSEAE
jgi:GTPase SAR1 family protein